MKNRLKLRLFLFSELDFWEFWGQGLWLIKMADICYNSCSTLWSSFELPSFHTVCYTIVKYHVSAFTGFTVSFKRFLLSMQSRKNSFDSLSRTLLVHNILNILIRTYGIRYSRMEQVKFVDTAFKKFEVIWFAEVDHITSNFLKAVFHKFYLVHSWILCPICHHDHQEIWK